MPIFMLDCLRGRCCSIFRSCVWGANAAQFGCLIVEKGNAVFREDDAHFYLWLFKAKMLRNFSHVCLRNNCCPICCFIVERGNAVQINVCALKGEALPFFSFECLNGECSTLVCLTVYGGQYWPVFITVKMENAVHVLFIVLKHTFDFGCCYF